MAQPKGSYYFVDMIHYTLSCEKAHRQRLCCRMEFEVKKNEKVRLQLPAWRPGRYELSNYAGNILNVKVTQSGKHVEFEKVERNLWVVSSPKKGSIQLSYEYYANEINAGSTFLDETQLYVNPVNCMFYIRGREKEGYELRLDMPSDFRYEGMKAYRNGMVKFKDLDELFDSPFICSEALKVHRFKESGISFTVAIQGNVKPDWKKIEKEFKPFIRTQIKAFGSCPVKRYVFLIQSQDKSHYHGVEHQYGTVLALGPAHSLMVGKGFYNLKAVSSHEFYHTWNVKYIRPQEMMPYEFSKENYHRQGYIIEGVTTYQGDLKMWQAGVISDKEFFEEIETHLERHIGNFGRFNLSVRESSFDTWVDGYKKGTPNRKVSIYTEGALAALATDLELIHRTKGKFGLDEVMKRLYERFAKKRKGYAEQDYHKILCELGGKTMSTFLNSLVDRADSYEKVLVKSLRRAGLNVKTEAISILSSYFGIQATGSDKVEVVAVHPESEAHEAGIRPGMILMGVEGQIFNKDVEQWLAHFKGVQRLEFLVQNSGKYANISLSASEHLLYKKYSIQQASKKENAMMKRWRKVV